MRPLCMYLETIAIHENDKKNLFFRFVIEVKC